MQQPLGVADVASAVFRDGYGCWGSLDLWLRAPLEEDQLRLLAPVLPEVTTALRYAQADTLRAVPSGPPEHPGPATLLMDPDLRIVGARQEWTRGCGGCCRAPTACRRCRRPR